MTIDDILQQYIQATTEAERSNALVEMALFLYANKFQVGQHFPTGTTYGDLPTGIEYSRDGKTWKWCGDSEELIVGPSYVGVGGPITYKPTRELYPTLVVTKVPW